MPVSEKQAQAVCSPTEWKTVVNSFPPKVSELGPSVAKKNANRIARFLSKAEADGDIDDIKANELGHGNSPECETQSSTKACR